MYWLQLPKLLCQLPSARVAGQYVYICLTLFCININAKSGCYTKEHSYPVGQDVTADRPHDQDRKGPVPAQNKQGHGKFLRVEPQKADKGGGTAGNDRKN